MDSSVPRWRSWAHPDDEKFDALSKDAPDGRLDSTE